LRILTLPAFVRLTRIGQLSRSAPRCIEPRSAVHGPLALVCNSHFATLVRPHLPGRVPAPCAPGAHAAHRGPLPPLYLAEHHHPPARRADSTSASPTCWRARRSPWSAPSPTFCWPSSTRSPSTPPTTCATSASPPRPPSPARPSSSATRAATSASPAPKAASINLEEVFDSLNAALLRRPAGPPRAHLERAPRQALPRPLRRRPQHHRRQPRLRPPLQPALRHRIPALPRDAPPQAPGAGARPAPLRPLPRVQSRGSALPATQGSRLHQTFVALAFIKRISLDRRRATLQTKSGADGQYSFRSSRPAPTRSPSPPRDSLPSPSQGSLSPRARQRIAESAAGHRRRAAGSHGRCPENQGVGINPIKTPAPWSSRAAISTRSPTIPPNCKTNCRRWPAPRPVPTAARSTLTASKAARFRPNPPSSKSASIKIPSLPNTTASATAASRSSPSPARKSSRAASTASATAPLSTPAIPSSPSQPSYYLYSYLGNISGPITKTSSYFFNAFTITARTKPSSMRSIPQPSPATLPRPIPRPMKFFNLNPRVDFQLTKNNFISIRDSCYPLLGHGNGVGTLNLPEVRPPATVNYTNELQIADTWVINPHLLMEPRFLWRRISNNGCPVSHHPHDHGSGSLHHRRQQAGHAPRPPGPVFMLQTTARRPPAAHTIALRRARPLLSRRELLQRGRSMAATSSIALSRPRALTPIRPNSGAILRHRDCQSTGASAAL
jgi:hypothetical protein